MDTADKVILLLGGEEQRKVLSPKFIEAIDELIEENKRLKKYVPVITEQDGGAYE